jgi:hypothetical protein
MSSISVWNPTEQQLINQGFFLLREYHPWGKDSCFKHPDGRIHFVTFVLSTEEHGQWEVFTPQEMYDYLEKNWEPTSTYQVQWKVGTMKRWFWFLD